MKIRLIMFTISFILYSSALWAEETALVRACFTKWPPYSYYKDGKASGFSITLYNIIMKRAGLTISYGDGTWDNCRKDFSKGKFNALVDSDTSNENTICLKKAPIPWAYVFWVHKDQKINTLSSYSQFNDQTVGYVRGYSNPDSFMRYQKITKYAVVNELQGLKMLEDKQIFAYFGDFVKAASIVKSNNLDVKVITPAVDTYFLSLCFHTSQKSAFEKCQKVLAEMYQDGTIDKLYRQYTGLSYKEFLSVFGGE